MPKNMELLSLDLGLEKLFQELFSQVLHLKMHILRNSGISIPYTV
jgi:hypothetical protein